ncbi:F-actin-monooxygenase MICAL2-like isoform X1 [Rana temporaria]|uniref:F-actin-monooxygenase MICAL2-like isoform X1 n=1 Tax=Rana temporaria TaxID=8407 RepID=UPI001AADC1F5|nr:F-actin-monooxygenase MICAL2-like isoform X1 [Rana temporaria]XP_040183878.1 F-actin-monooxygenase MICAL2-like isoform X1 [Rana temporaria]XP_040183879.1 F-actin-monooxygenase MICAL2-like isoform X1 [Rana temporaria]
MGENDDEKQSQAGQLFENFVQATTCKGTLQAFNILTRQLELDLQDHRHFYSKLKSKVTSWKAKALWNKLDKRYGQKEYKKGKACLGTKCLIIGGGPCGLRLAIELACLGAKVVVVEKRDTFSRNNVLHLWPYTIHDLRCLGAKKFYGKFCAGAIDHISIWQLQLMLFKIALLHGVEIHVNVEFVKLLEPPEDQENQKVGWRAEYLPQDHPLSDYEFDAIIGADGRRNTLEGFRRKEFRGKLAIAITANFVNRNTTAEAKVEEISGVAFIFNQKFFQDLKEETGIDLENIVYYKDSTHYFVMTAKKQSLLDKGVILNDNADAEALLCAQNVDQDSLQSYAREAADFATNYQLPSLDFAINHYEQPDVAMFDFTSMYASENAALVRERRGHHVLVALVGDSLLEPFWPMGTGCARGFLAAFDTAWMVKSWAQGTPPLEVLAERESIYRLLPQTTPENISKNFDQYTIDPASRYPNLNSSCVRGHQVRHLYITNELQGCPLERVSSIRRSVNLSRHESDVRPNRLLTWCQKQTEGYRNVNVTNLTGSWRNGLALCAIIHHFRPELLDFDSLNEDDAVRNNQLAFDIAEKEFGISPITSAKEMASNEEPDKLSMVLYLSKFYELFRGTPLRPVDSSRKVNENNGEALSSKPSNLILNNYLNLTLPRKRVPKNENKTEENDLNKRRRRTMQIFEEMGSFVSESIGSGSECSDTKEVINQNKVRSMATQLLAKFEENAPNTSIRRQALPLSDNSVPEPPPCDPPPVNPRFAKPQDPPPPPPAQPPPTRQFQGIARTSPVVRPPPLPSMPTVAPVTRVRAAVTVPREPDPPMRRQSREEVERPSSPAEEGDFLSSTCPSALLLTGIFERLQQIEEKAQQKRAQALAIRDFHKKNIREKAAHLASMFGPSDIPQDKLSAPRLPHFSSKIPFFEPRIPDLSTPSSATDSAPNNAQSEENTLLSPDLSPLSSPIPFYDPPASSAPSSPSYAVSAHCAAQSKKLLQHRVSDGGAPIRRKLYFPDPGQATVGNVSSRVGAVAEVLVCLYMSDHKSKTRSSELSSPDVGMTEPFAESPSSSPVSLSQKGSLRKEFPPNIGGSDTCYFCKKRVYVVERLSAEGHFFHRECFKCSFCSTVLRLGNYVFNMEEGKFYCQPHFMHSFSNNKQRKRRTDSKLQDEDKTWKKEEARAAEIMTDSPYSSSEDSSPDEPTSPKKSRSDSAFSNFKRRNSTVSTEWKAVRIGPGEEAAENNLTAVRVMVLSDESSSDKECAPEENHGRIHRRRLSSRKKERSSETQKDSGHPSTAIDALNRASNHPTVSPNKSQRWRKKIQSTFPLLIGRRSSHVTRDGSPTALSSPDDEVFNNNIPEHFLQPHLAGQSYKAPGEDYPDIPSYVPHYKALSSNHVAPKHSDYGAPRTLYPNSTYQYPNNPLENPSEYFTDHRDVFEKEERKDERNKQDLQRHEPNKLANPTLKKLVLSNEEKSNLLDWNSANPRQTQNFHEQPSYVNHDPGGEAESKPKSAFSILSSAIKRSFLRSVGSTSESPKPAAKPKPATPTNYFDIPSTFFRRSFSNSDPQTDPHDTEMNFLSYRSSTPRGDSRTSKEGPSWNSSQRSNISSKVEDMPKMLERFTLRENDRNGAISDIPFRNRKDSIFSSLRSITRPSENPSSAFSNDSWYVPWAIRRKANEKEAEERPRASSVAASSLLSVPHPEMKNRVAKSENYSSSSEDDLPYARSSPFKNSPVSKQRRRMERDARLRAKQEELKRLHKAQTIQRQLQETEEKQRALEIQGVRLEKALRGEADAGAQDEAQLLHEWFQLALEKSKLNRYESELLCVAKELDLEDKQGRLEQQLRERMMIDRALKDEKDIEEEDVILAEMMRVIEQRDQLVTRVDEQRLREATEEADRLAKLANPFARGHQLNLGVMSNRRII